MTLKIAFDRVPCLFCRPRYVGRERPRSRNERVHMGMKLRTRNLKTSNSVAHHPCVIGMARLIALVLGLFEFDLNFPEFFDFGIQARQLAVDARAHELGIE